MKWKKSTFSTLEERQKSIPGALFDVPDYLTRTSDTLPKIMNLSELAMAITERLVNREIVIVPDYDCDGIMSGVIMYQALLFLTETAKQLSGKNASTCRFVVPDRALDGYGFSVSHAEQITNSVVILLDNGIVQYDAIEKAKQNGCEVFVVDHHEPGERLPDADIIVNPHAIPGGDYDNYCAAGLCYRLVREIFQQNWLVRSVAENTLQEKMKEFLFMASIATVADVVPVLWENRVIIKEGTRYIPPRWEEICFTLMDSKKSILNEGDIAFKIAPAINAVGRLGELNADFIMDLAVGDALDQLAARMQYMNAQRKQMTKDAMKTVTITDRNAKVVIVKGHGVAAGIVGIIAGNLAERFGKPVFVFGDAENGLITGSARAMKGTLHLKKLLDKVEKQNPGITVRYGGHESAAGVTIRDEAFDAFEKALNALADYQPITEREYDFELGGDYDWFNIYDAIQEYAPFGEGNPSPLLHIHMNPQTDDVVIMGKEHLKIKDGIYEAVGFNMAGRYDRDVPECDLYGCLQLNEYRGGMRIQLNIEDFTQPKKSSEEKKPLTDFARSLSEKMKV